MIDPALIVVGGGIGGAAAALRAAQYMIPTVWVLGDRATRKASRAAYVKNIDNMIGVHPGIVQSQIADALRDEFPKAAQRAAAEHLHISTNDLVENAAARIRSEFGQVVDFVEKRTTALSQLGEGFQVTFEDGTQLAAPAVVLSTGVMDRQPIIHKTKGDRDVGGMHWVYPYANQETLLYCIRCEGHLTVGRTVGIVGAGEAAAEVALMIRERYGSSVVVLTAGESPSWTEKQATLLDHYEVRIVEGRLTDIHGAAKGSQLKGFTVESGERVNVEMAFIVMGLYKVYNELARDVGAELEGGDTPEDERHVMVNTFGETSVRNVFAVGDMAKRAGEPSMKQVYTAQEYAVRAVDTVDRRRRRAARTAIIARLVTP